MENDRKPDIYLKTLTIKNIATFDHQEIQFHPGFNAIIGETGSGKSLILDCLELLFGARASKSLIRKGKDNAFVEALFICDSEEVKGKFDQLGYPLEDNEIVLKRSLKTSGSGKSFINYQQAPLGHLQSASSHFIDLVGQFENQRLLNPSYQIALLDHYANIEDKVETFQNLYRELSSLQEKIDEFEKRESDRLQELDFIEFQIKELEDFSPDLKDEEDLESQKEIILNIEKLATKGGQAKDLIEGENGILESLGHLRKIMEVFPANIVPNEFEQLSSNYIDMVSDISYRIDSTLSEHNEISENIDNVIDRLDGYQKLKRKFGVETKELVSKLEELSNKRQTLKDQGRDLGTLTQQLEEMNKKTLKIASELHKGREKATKELSKSLTKIIQELNMEGAQLRFQLFKRAELGPYGLTELEFKGELNKGEGEFPIKKMASGGELSRILLALRQVLSTKSSISVFLFDEIDAGIGGKTALKMGKSLKAVSMSSQVISITHLPQIAFHADSILKVEKGHSKREKEDRTISQISSFEGKDAKSIIEEMVPL